MSQAEMVMGRQGISKMVVGESMTCNLKECRLWWEK